METRRSRAVETTADTLHATLQAFAWDEPLTNGPYASGALTRDGSRDAVHEHGQAQGAASPSHRASG